MSAPSIKLSISIQVEDYGPRFPVALFEGDFEEKLEKAANCRADGVELITTDPQALKPAFIRACLSKAGLEAAAVASGGLSVVAGRTLLNPSMEVARAAQTNLQDLIRFAAEVGAVLVNIGSFRGKLAWVEGDGSERLASILYDSAEYASACGVRLAIEPLNRYETDMINNVDQGLAFLCRVNHASLGLLLDTFHINIEESSWTEPFLKAIKYNKLFHVHIGDNNRLYPGGGLIDFYKILSILRQSHYEGYISAELLPFPTPDLAAQNTLINLRSILERLSCD
jgi:5-keto-L-gluconate epimerase